MFGEHDAVCTVVTLLWIIITYLGYRGMYRHMYRVSGRSSIFAGLSITQDAIRVPNGPEMFNEVLFRDIRSLMVVQMAYGPGIRLEVEGGVIVLPWELYDDLVIHDLDVVDSRRSGYAGRSMDEAFPPPPISGLDSNELTGPLVTEYRHWTRGKSLWYYYRRVLLFVLPGTCAIIVGMESEVGIPLMYAFFGTVGLMMVFFGFLFGFIMSLSDSIPRFFSYGHQTVGKGTFYPWGAYECMYCEKAIKGQYVLMKPNGPSTYLTDDIPKFETVASLANERVADQRYNSDAYHKATLVRFDLGHFEVLAYALLCGVVLTQILRHRLESSELVQIINNTFDGSAHGYLFLVLFFTIVVFVVGMRYVLGHVGDMMPMRKSNLMVPISMVVVLLLLFSYLPLRAGPGHITLEISIWYLIVYSLLIGYLVYVWSRNRGLPRLSYIGPSVIIP